MNDEIYWLWLLKCLGSASALEEMLAYFGSARSVYEAGSDEWRISGAMTAGQIQALQKYSPSECGDVLRACWENGWDILTPESIYYPQKLRELRNFPPVLFAQGDKTVLLRSAKIAMVGTRKATAYSLRVATALSEALAAAGMTVVSGGALGIDSAAHRGALQAGGKTVAVLGCGFGTRYLRENAALRCEIAEHGVLLTEFPPFAPASRTTFPLRNRIISGLSLGTVVVEAGEKSGSLITARCAAEQGRDVFAVPGDLLSSAFTGANRLIRDGAKPVFTPQDILEEYAQLYPDEIAADTAELSFAELLQKSGCEPMRPAEMQAPPKQKPVRSAAAGQANFPTRPAQSSLPQAASEAAKSVYAVLESACHIDEISLKTNLPVAACLAALTELELFGCVTGTQGKKYKRI